MEGAPEYCSNPSVPTDLDRIRARLEAERFQPDECWGGPPAEIESVEYPQWYKDGQALLGILNGDRLTDGELRALSGALGIDLDAVLGVEKSPDEQTVATRQTPSRRGVEKG